MRKASKTNYGFNSALKYEPTITTVSNRITMCHPAVQYDFASVTANITHDHLNCKISPFVNLCKDLFTFTSLQCKQEGRKA